MLPEGAIRAEHVWKRFRPDRQRRFVRDQLRVVGDRVRRRARPWTWALRDVDLSVEPGEAIGLVGLNGSGKSTLLKLLTRVMYPYAGSVDVGGRVGALIEIRAGIHPELTGRENIHLYGSLLGLRRKGVARRFDAIVDFAEIDHAIDRQVKFYSSGMQLRLGFAVAAFLDPHVLLVDEVLAVGDATFQQRCLDRIQAVLSNGTTLVFVSHDLASVESTTTRGVWLQLGSVRSDGPVRDVLSAYRASIEEVGELERGGAGVLKITAVDVGSGDGDFVRTQGALDVQLVVESPVTVAGRVHVGVSEGPATPIFVVERDTHFTRGRTELRCEVPHLPLPRGRYFVWVAAFARRRVLLDWHPVAHFDVMGPDLLAAPPGVVRLAPVHVEAHWDTESTG